MPEECLLLGEDSLAAEAGDLMRGSAHHLAMHSLLVLAQSAAVAEAQLAAGAGIRPLFGVHALVLLKVG